MKVTKIKIGENVSNGLILREVVNEGNENGIIGTKRRRQK